MNNLFLKILINFFLLHIIYLKSFKYVNGTLTNNDNDPNQIIDISHFVSDDNWIQKLPDKILNGSNPLRINSSDRNLTFIPSEYKLFRNLTRLNLAGNQLTDINYLPITLERLLLHDNQIKILPEHFFNLVNIEALTLGKNKLENFPKSMGKLAKLKKLDISSNKICIIPLSIVELKNIEIIFLKSNKITIIPCFINKLTNLIRLDLSFNYIDKFPENCETLDKLVALDLSFNKITNINTICNLKNLEELFVNHNQISDIHENICNLQNLKRLDLSKNSISNFDITCKLYSLEELYIYNNQIIKISKNIKTLINLQILDLSNNNISILPKELENCKKLKKLLLSCNSIANIKTICKIHSLEFLYIYKNCISEIPKNISNLKNLKIIKLSLNNIFSIPKELLKCKELRMLYLDYNEIEKISIDLFDMLSNLEILDLSKNPLIYPVNSTEIDILELKIKMGDRLIVNGSCYEKMIEIYQHLNEQPKRFNFVNLKKCKPSSFPTHIYSKQELLKKINDWKKNIAIDEQKNNAKMVIIDPNEITDKVKSFDTAILTDYIHHLYNPKKEYHKWNVPLNLIDDFKKYIGAIINKLFSSTDTLFVEGHLNSLSTAICYCPDRQKNEMIFLYDLLINEDKKSLENLKLDGLEYELESEKYLENIKKYIENTIKKLIGKAKIKMLMHVFDNLNNKQNVHIYNYWIYMLKDIVGFDVFGDKPTIYGRDKFDGKIELGMKAYFDNFSPEWLIIELKNLINNNSNLVCKISEFLYFSDIENKIHFVECEDEDILFTKCITTEFCEFILKNMEIIID